jgi:hypothetical protein
VNTEGLLQPNSIRPARAAGHALFRVRNGIAMPL